MANNTEHLGNRVSSLETSVESLTNNLASLAKTVEIFANNTHDEIKDLSTTTNKSIKELSDNLNTQAKPNWPTWISGIGLMVVLIASIGSSYLLPLQTRTEADKEFLNYKLASQKESDALRFQHLKELGDQRANYYITEFGKNIDEMQEKINLLYGKVEALGVRSEQNDRHNDNNNNTSSVK